VKASSRPPGMPRDVLDVIGSIYDVDGPEEPWISALARTGSALVSFDTQVTTYAFDASDAASPWLGSMALNDGLVPVENIQASFQEIARHPLLFRHLHRGRLCGRASELFAEAGFADFFAAMRVQMRRFGADDVLMINGVDPSGKGCSITCAVPLGAKLERRTVARLTRVAAHMATAYRLRRRLAAAQATPLEHAEAVLTPAGKVEHAAVEAQSRASRDVLADAARRIERLSRRRGRAVDPDHGLEEWKGLVAARWTLVEQFERDGKRYLLAQRNDAMLTGMDALSSRERQVVAYAAEGHSNKLIAYELGLAASTARERPVAPATAPMEVLGRRP
jgi:hypothetical protein